MWLKYFAEINGISILIVLTDVYSFKFLFIKSFFVAIKIKQYI